MRSRPSGSGCGLDQPMASRAAEFDQSNTPIVSQHLNLKIVLSAAQPSYVTCAWSHIDLLEQPCPGRNTCMTHPSRRS